MSEKPYRAHAMGTSLRDFYYTLFRHKYKVIFTFLVVMAGALLVAFLSVPRFRSTAKLFIRLGRESVALDPLASIGTTVHVSQPREFEINSELEVLKSHKLLAHVVEVIGPERILSSGRTAVGQIVSHLRGVVSKVGDLFESMIVGETPQAPGDAETLKRERAVEQLLKCLHIEAMDRSNIIHIACEAADPKLAQEVVSKLIEAYLEEHLRIHSHESAYEFFRTQTAQLEKELLRLEDQIRSYKNQKGISATIAECQKALLDQAAGLRKQLQTIRASRAAAQARIAELEGLIGKLKEEVVIKRTTGLPNSAADTMRSKLYELKLQQESALAAYNKSSKQVEELRRQIRKAEELLAKEPPSRSEETLGVNTVRQQLMTELLQEKARYTSLAEEEKALSEQLALLEAELKERNTDEVMLTRLKRMAQLLEANYRKYAENLEQARIDEAREKQRISNIRVVQPATLSPDPVGPSRLVNLFLGFLLAVACALAVAYGAESLDHTVNRPEDLERKCSLPVLTSVPRLAEKNALVPVLDGTGDRGTADRWRTAPLLKQYFEVLGSQVVLRLTGRSQGSAPVVALTSCRFGEGTSTLVANLACTVAAEDNCRAVVLQAHEDGNSPGKLLSGSVTGAVAHLEKQRKERQPQRGNVTVVSAVSDPASLSDFSSLVRTLRKQYDFVILDAPPILEGSDVARWAKVSDGVILVVEAGRMRYEVVRHAKELLERSGVPLIGVVLNKRDFPVPEWLYRQK